MQWNITRSIRSFLQTHPHEEPITENSRSRQGSLGQFEHNTDVGDEVLRLASQRQFLDFGHAVNDRWGARQLVFRIDPLLFGFC